MKLQPPSLGSLVAFLVLLGSAVLLSLVHAWLLAATRDPADIAWMNTFSAAAGMGALAALGVGTVRRNGNGDGT